MSRSAIILERLLSGDKFTTKELAEELFVTSALVSKVRRDAVNRGLMPRTSMKFNRSVIMDADVKDALRTEARKRGYGMNELMTRIIGTVARDDLFVAVLDDA